MKTNLSICMISDDFLPAATGVGVYLKMVAPELAKRGHKVSVITTRRPGEPAIQKWEGVTIYRVFTIKMFDFYQALPRGKKIREILASEKPDVIHHHYAGYMMMRVCHVAQALEIPQISTFHFSAEVLTQPLPMRPFRSLIRHTMASYNNRMNMVIAPSQNLIKQIADEGVSTEIRYITNPVVFGDSTNVIPIERTTGFTILYAGRLGAEKNISFLIKSFSQVVKSNPDAILWIAGRGPEGPSLEKLCAELNISDKVKFLGFLDHPTLARYYKACDVFVLPSLQEAQALAAMEAMWFSRPVIVTNAIVSAEEMVEQGVNGYIVNPDSPVDLTQRLETLAGDATLRTSQGEASRKRANLYRPEPVIKSLEEAYLSVVPETQSYFYKEILSLENNH